jgi:hypothetical protein
MRTSRRNIFRSALATGLTTALPSLATASTTDSTLKAKYAKLDAAASQPVFKRELFPDPAIIGNGVATIVISRWEGEFDAERARIVLNSTHPAVEDDIALREHAGVM